MAHYPTFLCDALDLHMHSGPDAIPRVQTAGEIARDAADAGLRAILLKNHALPTTTIASELDDPRGVRVFGSLTLNPSVGGWNVCAVKAAIAEGARCIWLPTYGARRHLEIWGRLEAYPFPANFTGLSVFDDDTGALREDVREIIQIVADANIILATGHLGPEECVAVAKAAKEAGATRVVMTHPSEEVSALSIDQQKEAIAHGALIEHCLLVLTPNCPGKISAARLAEQIQAVGAENVFLTSDLGQIKNPPIVEGFGILCQQLLEAGIGQEELRTMIVDNPSRLVDL